MKKDDNFDPKEILKPPHIIQRAGSHLYKIGLSHFKFGESKRSKFFNPFFVFHISFILWLRYLVFLFIKIENPVIYILIGDFSYFLNLRFHISLSVVIYYSISIISQIIHFYYYNNKIYPSFAQPFDMISGLVSPESIGLTNERDISSITSTIFKRKSHRIMM